MDITELIASLNGFPALRNLLLGSKLLFHGADEAAKDGSVFTRLLPLSIVSLQVVVADDMETEVFPHLASSLLQLAQAASRGQFPNLKSVSCCTEQRFDVSGGLDVMFASAGVGFGYDGWPFNDGMPGRRVCSRGSSPARSITPVSSEDENL